MVRRNIRRRHILSLSQAWTTSNGHHYFSYLPDRNIELPLILTQSQGGEGVGVAMKVFWYYY